MHRTFSIGFITDSVPRVVLLWFCDCDVSGIFKPAAPPPTAVQENPVTEIYMACVIITVWWFGLDQEFANYSQGPLKNDTPLWRTRQRVCNRTVPSLNWGFKQDKTRNLRQETQQPFSRLQIFTSAWCILEFFSLSSEHTQCNLPTFRQQSVHASHFLYCIQISFWLLLCSLKIILWKWQKSSSRGKKVTHRDLKLHNLFLTIFTL